MLEDLIKYCEDNSLDYKQCEPMSAHTSFKIGGSADIFITLSNAEELKDIINRCKAYNVDYFIIGKGSNLLVSDKGIRGAVISLSGFNSLTVSGDEISCGAGLTLSEICRFARENSLTGLEFAYGIPGGLGGALYMNAGAYGGEMSGIVKSALVLTDEGEITEISASDMDFGYRKSIFKEKNMIVLSSVLKLSKGNTDEIQSKMDDFISRRMDKQPLEYPSAGSFFKRPEGYFAGALIEKNGLKGFSIGGAEVSRKHAGFIINKGGATCEDVKALSEAVSDKVFEADGVKLEREVIFVGEK